MNSFLIKTGYILDVVTGIWSRQDYTGIAYSDGDEVEQRIASIINEVSDLSVLSSELRQHCTDWPSLYHLSGTRANILRPFENDLHGDILEIGAGCGAITRYLGECGGNVLALEGSPRRAAIARARTRDLQNVTVVSDRFDLFLADQKFDAITLIGVLEYANLFTPGESPALNMLERVRALLKPDGKLIIAIENQLGLKYFAGAPEDHLGQPMYGIEGRYRNDQPQTFGRKELSSLIKKAGFNTAEFLAPFPDYKLPVSIITEHGFSSDVFDASALAYQSVRRDPQLPPILTFSPELVWPTLVHNGLALELSNSFLVVAGNANEQVFDPIILAWHFTTERLKEFCKETLFLKAKEGKIEVRYRLLAPESNTGHNASLKFDIPDVEEYIFGTPLSQELISIVSRDGWCIEEVAAFMMRYLNIVVSFAGMQGYSQNILSPATLLPGYLFDAIPQNIMITSEGSWRLIDKEWALNQDIPVGYLVFKAIIQLLNSVTRVGLMENGSNLSVIELLISIYDAMGFSQSESEIKSYISLDATVYAAVMGGPLNLHQTLESLHSPLKPETLAKQLERTEQAKAIAEELAYSRLAELERTEQAKAIAEELAYSRLAKLEQLRTSKGYKLLTILRMVPKIGE